MLNWYDYLAIGFFLTFVIFIFISFLKTPLRKEMEEDLVDDQPKNKKIGR